MNYDHASANCRLLAVRDERAVEHYQAYCSLAIVF
jgi:hypothetical protein